MDAFLLGFFSGFIIMTIIVLLIEGVKDEY